MGKWFRRDESYFLILISLVLAATVCVSLYVRFSQIASTDVVIKAQNRFKTTLTVVCDRDSEPYSFIGKDGRPSGFDVELINYLANRMHMNVDIRALSWKESREAMYAGSADILTGIDYTQDSKLALTIPLLESGFTVFGWNDYQYLTDLYGKNIAAVKGDGYYDHYFETLLSESRIRFFNSNEAAFRSLLDGDCNYLIMKEPVGRRLLLKSGKADVVYHKHTLLNTFLCYGVDKKNEAMLAELNASIRAGIKDSTIDMLAEKWFGDYVKLASPKGIFETYYGAIIFWALALALIMLGISAMRGHRFKKETQAEMLRGDTLQRKAEIDLLTGVLNKGTFTDRVSNLLKDSHKSDGSAFFILDMDKFKAVNDNFGHSAGDDCLAQVAGKLKELFRQDDVIGRLGGDEFGIFMLNACGDEVIAAKAGRVNKALRISFKSGSASVVTTASIGISVCPRDGSTFGALYANADKALYASKNAGRNGFSIFGRENRSE